MKAKLTLFSILTILLLIGFGCSNNFEQVGYFKKKLPNGSNDRVFSFYVKNFSDNEKTWTEIEKFAKRRMYTSGGFTTVFFFNNRHYTPDVTFVAELFDVKYEKYCVAAYWKYANGHEQFSRYPFK